METIPRAEPTAGHRRLPRPMWIFLATVLLLVTGLAVRAWLPTQRRVLARREISRLGGGMMINGLPAGWAWSCKWLGISSLRVQEVHRVNLRNTRATDQSLTNFGALIGVVELHLPSTQITDAGLAHLKGLSTLKMLDLSNTHVTDAGLEQLKVLPTLEYLDLEGTHITDEGLEHLKGLSHLRFVGLKGTQVTEAGFAKLKETLPRVRMGR